VDALRKLSIAIMLLVWIFTSTILTWGLTGQINFITLMILFIAPYLLWLFIEVVRRRVGN